MPADAHPTMFSDRMTWQPEGVAEPLTIDLATLFEAALGD
jgi:hypothetical protein